MNLNYLLGFLLALVLTVSSMPVLKILALKVGAVDIPNARKIHKRPLPRIGGVGIFIGILLPMLVLLPLNRPLLAFIIGLILVFIVGLWDDIKGLSAWTKLFWQVVAAGAVLAGGIGIILVTDPFGGVIYLDNWIIPIEILGISFNLIPIANLVSILWIVGVINTVNFLDGLDGLASGIVIIAALTLFTMATLPVIDDTVVAQLALILAGAAFGFWLFNKHPSSILMGDSGSYVIGMMLAVLAIYSGSKIAVGILVLGVAIVDSVWAVLRRLMQGRSPFSPDRGHIHHQLLDSGLNQWQVVGYLYAVAAALAASVVFFNIIAGLAVLVMALVATVSIVRIRGRV